MSDFIRPLSCLQSPVVGIGRPSRAFPPSEPCGLVSQHTAQALIRDNEVYYIFLRAFKACLISFFKANLSSLDGILDNSFNHLIIMSDLISFLILYRLAFNSLLLIAKSIKASLLVSVFPTCFLS